MKNKMNLTHTIRDMVEMKKADDFQSGDGQFTTSVDQPELATKPKGEKKVMKNPSDQWSAKYQMEEDDIEEAAALDTYIKSKGWNPALINRSKKQQYVQSDLFKQWAKNRKVESVEVDEGAMMDSLYKVSHKNTKTGERKEHEVRASSPKEARDSIENHYAFDYANHKHLNTKKIDEAAQQGGSPLDQYLNSLGWNPETISFEKKQHYAQSDLFKNWQKTHFREDVSESKSHKVIAAVLNKAKAGVPDAEWKEKRAERLKKSNDEYAASNPKSIYKKNESLMGSAGSTSEEVEITEAKDGYTIYHPTYSAAVQHAAQHLEKKGLHISDDNWFHHVNSGPKKPGEGKTNSLNIPLHKDGKETKKHAHIQVYNRGNDVKNAYELNMYHESVNEDKYQDAQSAAQTVGMEVEDSKVSRKREMSKSARMVKALYKHHKMSEDIYDHEKEDKPTKGSAKPKIDRHEDEDNYGDDKSDAKITITGGKTETGEGRDTIEIDPMMKKRLNQQQQLKKDSSDRDTNPNSDK